MDAASGSFSERMGAVLVVWIPGSLDDSLEHRPVRCIGANRVGFIGRLCLSGLNPSVPENPIQEAERIRLSVYPSPWPAKTAVYTCQFIV